MTTTAMETGHTLALWDAQLVLADMIAKAEDNYQANKGTELGLVAFGQLIALRGASERLYHLAAKVTRA